MTTKLEKMARRLNDEFRYRLADAVKEKFGIEIVTELNIIDLRIHSRRVDDVDFTEEQYAFMQAFEKGYLEALSTVRKG